MNLQCYTGLEQVRAREPPLCFVCQILSAYCLNYIKTCWDLLLLKLGSICSTSRSLLSWACHCFWNSDSAALQLTVKRGSVVRGSNHTCKVTSPHLLVALNALEVSRCWLTSAGDTQRSALSRCIGRRLVQEGHLVQEPFLPAVSWLKTIGPKVSKIMVKRTWTRR
jgi:hypothetical protein